VDEKELPDTFSDSDEDQWLEDLSSSSLAKPPNAEKRKELFTTFSKLKNLIWLKNRGMLGKFNGRARKTITFTRPDAEQKPVPGATDEKSLSAERE